MRGKRAFEAWKLMFSAAFRGFSAVLATLQARAPTSDLPVRPGHDGGALDVLPAHGSRRGEAPSFGGFQGDFM